MKSEYIRTQCYICFIILVVNCQAATKNGGSFSSENSASQRNIYTAEKLEGISQRKEFSDQNSFNSYQFSIPSRKLRKHFKINENSNTDVDRQLYYRKAAILLPWKSNVFQTVKSDLSKLDYLDKKNVNNNLIAQQIKVGDYISKKRLQKRVLRQADTDSSHNNVNLSNTNVINSGTTSNHINTAIPTSYKSTLIFANAITTVSASPQTPRVTNFVNEQVYDTDGSGSIVDDNVTVLNDGQSAIKNESQPGITNIPSSSKRSALLPEPSPSATPVSEPETTPESIFNATVTKVTTSGPSAEPSPSSEPETPIPEPSTAGIISSSKSVSEIFPTSEITPEPNSEPQTTAEPKSEPETTPEPKSEPETTPEPKSEPETTSEPKSEPETTSEPKSEPETTPEPKSEPETTAEPKSEPETTAEPKSEPETTAEPKSEPETTAEPKSEPETTAEPKSEPETTAEPKSEPETTAEPKSEPETTAEPKSEPETSAEPKSTAEPKSEPEPETTSEPEPDPESENSFAEPSPVWDLAKEEWRWGWEFLIYFFGVMFILLGLFSFISVVRLWRMNHLLSKNYFLTLNILIIIKCVLRGCYLLVDGYNANDTFHDILNYFLYSTAFPCLTSAFSILFYALLLATKMQVISTKIQKLPVLIGIIVFHFALSIVTDVIVGLFSDARILLLVCQFFYILWGIVLFVAYFYIFRKLYKSAMKRQKALAQQTSSLNSNEKPKKYHTSKYTLSLSVKVTFIAALFGVGCVALELYGIFGVYKIFLQGHRPEPWPWWIYQFSLRTMEFLMCLTMVYVASQPIKYQKRKDDGTCSLYFMPFKRVCCCCCRQYDLSHDGEFIWASSNAIAVPSSNSENYKFPKYKKKKNSQNGNYALEKNGSAKPVKLAHIVIEDGRVRFKSQDDVTDNSSELGNSLPDLVNGNVVQDDVFEVDTLPRNNIQSNGVYNVGFNETEGMNYKNEKLAQMNGMESRTPKQSVDLDRTSIGTFGTDIGRPSSSLNLADSMEWEFEKVYERSFVEDETNSVKSLPNVIMGNNSDDPLRSKLLSSEKHDHPWSPDYGQDQGSNSSGQNDTIISGGPNSPTQKPLIQSSGRRSSYEDRNFFVAQTRL